MDWINLISPILSGILGVVVTLLLFALRIGRYIEKISKLEELPRKIDILEKQVAALQQFEKNAHPSIFISRSPLQLTLYAEQLLKSIDFLAFFETIKDELVNRLDKLNLKTRYDVQEKSKELFQQMRDEDILISIKTKAYDKGKNYNDILLAASIPLRDYYLSLHPEINK